MKAFTSWMEQKFVPVAAKIASYRPLIAIRDAFIGIMPITMAGAIASLLNVFLRDLPAQFITDYVPNSFFTHIIGINGMVWWGTTAMLAIVFVVALGYNIAKQYDVDPFPASVISLASFIAVMPQTAKAVLELGTEIPAAVSSFFSKADIVIDVAEETLMHSTSVGAWGNINSAYTGATGLFTALFVAFVVTGVYIFATKRNWTIRMPDSVPPAVSKAFTSIIPGTLAIFSISIIGYIVNAGTGMALNDLIQKYIAIPFLNLSQGLGAVIIITLAVQILWFFGLHGTNILAPVLEGAWKTALIQNTNIYNSGVAPFDIIDKGGYLWTRGSFDAYAWMGGAGCTIALLIAILIFSKKKNEKAVAAMALPMGVFNINEPVSFGLPLVLNPVYFIPYIIISPILVTIAYLLTQASIIPPVFIEVPWIMPPVIYAFLATGGNFVAALVALINLAIAVAIWSIFVIIGNKVEMND